MESLERKIISEIRKSLGKEVNENYVTQAKKYDLNTELLGEKSKAAHQKILEAHVEKLNEISAFLDSAERDLADVNNSKIRSLKQDEVYNLNASFLHAFYFENIGDTNSVISMDSLSFMRLERDFGSFDAWQEDFVACALSARNGWAVTYFDMHLQRYMNTVIDLHSQSVMTGMFPVVVMDCWEHSYYRDYLKDRKSYVFGMMKELNWPVIEDRVKKADRISKVLRG